MKVAVLIPCYNEELTIVKVINDFKKVLPDATIYVYDNNSKDNTFNAAKDNGAIVIKESRQGKGNVVRSMFRNIDADCYVMVDGDDTYPAEFVHKLIKPIIDNKADMVIGDRLSNGTYNAENKRLFHGFGNSLVKHLIGSLFNNDIKDIMTGYRAFNKYFVKTMPVMSKGFEIETEMSIHALDKNFLITEIPIDYRDRPEGSTSKLNTFRDGIKVIKTIFNLFKDYNPFAFFSFFSIISLVFGLIVGIPVIKEFILTSFITKMPSAILAVGFVVVSFLLFSCGLILDTIAKTNKKSYELYLNEYKIREFRENI